MSVKGEFGPETDPLVHRSKRDTSLSLDGETRCKRIRSLLGKPETILLGKPYVMITLYNINIITTVFI